MSKLDSRRVYKCTSFYFSFKYLTPIALIEVPSQFARLFDRCIPTSDEQGRCLNPDSKGKQENLRRYLDVKGRRIIFLLTT